MESYVMESYIMESFLRNGICCPCPFIYLCCRTLVIRALAIFPFPQCISPTALTVLLTAAISNEGIDTANLSLGFGKTASSSARLRYLVSCW